MDETEVVTCFLRNRGEVLLLQRSERVGSYARRWGGVSGHAEGDPDAQARREIAEETGLAQSDVSLVRRGDPLTVTDRGLDTRWIVHPFLFDTDTRAVTPNWETQAREWASPPTMLDRETVPGLWAAYDRVRPRLADVAADTTHGSSSLSLRALAVLRDEAARLAAGRDGALSDRSALLTLARDLRSARPSMVVIATRIDRVMSDAAAPAAVAAAARAEIDRVLAAQDACAAAAGEAVAGRAVATLSRSGTVREAVRAGDPERLLVAASRPGGEGVSVAADLAGEGWAVTLTTDAAFAHQLSAWGADALLVGADGILPDGRVVNKVGTRAGAVAASHEGCAVVVAATTDKVHPAGTASVDLGERDRAELSDGEVALDVANPTFDVTPPELVDRIVTEEGPMAPADVEAVAETHRARAAWAAEE